MARTSKFTSTVERRIIEALELGATYELAAQAANINYETFRVWMRDKPAFSVAVKTAEGKSALAALAIVQRAAAERDWQAAAWLLERRHGYTRPAPVIQAGQVGVTLRIEWTRDWRQIGGSVEQATLAAPNSSAAQAAQVDDGLPELDLSDVVG